MSQIRCSTSR